MAFLKNLSAAARRVLGPAGRGVLLAAAAVVLLGACSKPVETVDEIRPVRVMQVSAGSLEHADEFSGEVVARVESRLGFRVAGKIIARNVDVGSQVHRGQVLMQLDTKDLQLAQDQAAAALRAAQSSRDIARADLGRYRELRTRNFVSQALLDAKESAYQAAQASYQQALAAYRSQANQSGYALLKSDVDGVVTGVDAEVGQVVAAGAPVVRVARAGDKEVVIGIPEDKVDALHADTDIAVRTWARPNEVLPGRLRELSPVADPATRTYRAKIAIPDKPEVRLGMTAYVRFIARSSSSQIRVPLTALFPHQSASAVWVVDHGAVRLAPVRIAGTAGNDVIVADGLAPGQTIVTAGVNLLRAGQKVKILGADAAAERASDLAENTDAVTSGAAR